MKKIISLIIAAALFFCVSQIADCGGYKGEAPDVLTSLDGVTLTTEFEYYAEGSAHILAVWENSTEYSAMFGDSWELDKFNSKTGKWIRVFNVKSVGFNSVGYTLFSGGRNTHTYHITDYEKNVKQGRYRIRTDFSVPEESYDITAEFTITKNAQLIKNSSALDSGGIAIGNRDFSENILVCKNMYSYDAAVKLNNGESYEIAKGNGGLGVISCRYYADGGNKFLIYSYSREDETGKYISYIGVFDIIAKQEICQSEVSYEYDVFLSSSENHIAISFVTCETYTSVSRGYTMVVRLIVNHRNAAYLKFENGVFYTQMINNM